MDGFYLFSDVIDAQLEQKLIWYIENDSRFYRYVKIGKIFYQMAPCDFPDVWKELLTVIESVHPSCRDFDYALQLKYTPGVSFMAHYDSRKRWKEFIVGVNLNSTANLYFTRKDCETINIEVPPRSIYVLSGDAQYKWKHGIKKVKDLRYSITLRKKTEYEKRMETKY